MKRSVEAIAAEGRAMRCPVFMEDQDSAVATAPRPVELPLSPARAAEGDTWVVVLAGGEGRRIQAYTTLRDGAVVPKQFCRFRDDRTLLAATLDRALCLVPPERILAVVLEEHRSWWEPELEDLPGENILSQPSNRGTAVAILCALAEVFLRDPDPRLVVMPSDHDVEHEGVLGSVIHRALRVAAAHPGEVVLLGVTPTQLDCEYGLIMTEPVATDGAYVVQTFVEKPSPEVGRHLIRRGGLWNSFVFAASGGALLSLYETALLAFTRSTLRWLPVAHDDVELMQLLFDGMPVLDFSHEVLQRCASRLRLVRVPACGWTDLGTPARLAVWLDRHREASFWRNRVMPWPAVATAGAGALQPGGA